MFEFLFGRRGPSHSLVIEGRDEPITVKPRETILEAALREGYDFPSDCRGGACGTCKCKLVEGTVNELSDKSVVLEPHEVKAGFILACQSVPKSNVKVALVAEEHAGPKHPVVRTKGVVSKRRTLTHDTVELVVRLDSALTYSAGQYARIVVPKVGAMERSYSFAHAPKSDHGEREVAFYVREVPGGALSPFLVRGDVEGMAIQVDGPHGEFRLRDGAGPIVTVAGGSGLAPVRALLEQAVAEKTKRPLVCLFGARTQADLYEREALAELGRAAIGSFALVPVLSSEPEGSSWSGERGFVTSKLASYVTPDAQIYMCGPPPMIDAGIAELEKLGVGHDRIFHDKFLDESHLAKKSV